MTLVMHICRNISLQAIRQNSLAKESPISIGLQEVNYVQTVESTAHGLALFFSLSLSLYF
jgi:hypothetical protein